MSAFSKAADILRETGWQRHDLGHLGRPHCALGALYDALEIDRSLISYDVVNELPEIKILAQTIAEHLPESQFSALYADEMHTGTIYIWNDNEVNDVDEVLLMLKRAEEKE